MLPQPPFLPDRCGHSHHQVNRPASAGVAAIDWGAPWLAPWRECGETVARSVCSGMAQPDALNQAAVAPVCFVPQSELPGGVAYEPNASVFYAVSNDWTGSSTLQSFTLDGPGSLTPVASVGEGSIITP